MKTLGIIGGSGTRAGLHLIHVLVELGLSKLPKSDADYPSFIYYNCTKVPMNELGQGDEKAVVWELLSATKRLMAAHCDYVLVACNTAHRYATEIAGIAKHRFLNLIESACRNVKTECVGIVCSSECRRLDLYGKSLAHSTVLYGSDQDQSVVDEIIQHVIEGTESHRDGAALQGIVCRLHDRGAKVVILGCTELPVVHCFDSPKVLDAGALAIEHAYHLL